MSQTRTIRAGAAAAWGSAFCIAYGIACWLLAPWLPAVDFLPDTGASWYYWKLPDPTWATRASAWGGYLAHQIAIWYLIYRAQTGGLRYSKLLHPVNVAALAVNAAFVLLHLAQTYIWYDGLAQDVSIWTSQGSVVLLLVMVLLMENSRRGLIFGAKAPGLTQAGQFARKYHGFVFSWAVIYTFWYHPMEATLGHVLGTVYTLLLMLQGSLFFTRMHTNRHWTVLMEAMVIVHGAMVAYLTGNQWPMFLFGFAAIFIVTQMHGLGWSKALRAGFVLAYAGAAAAVYAGRSVFGVVEEIVRIPLIEYLLVFIVALVLTGIARLLGFSKPAPS